MERRAILAFALSMVLFLIYDMVYLQPRTRKQREQAKIQAEQLADSLAAVARADSIRAALNPPPSQLDNTPALSQDPARPVLEGTTDAPAQPEAEPIEIVVSTGKLELVLSSRGAEIMSAQLPDFETDGAPVELFPQIPEWGNGRILSFAIRGDDRQLRSFSNRVFDVTRNGNALRNRQRVVVSGDEPVEVVFTLALEDGVQLDRYYTFYADRYDFETGARLTTSDTRMYGWLVWGFGPGMQSTEENVEDDRQNFKVIARLGEETDSRQPKDFGKTHSEQLTGQLSWFSLRTKYFTTALIPLDATRSEVELTGDKVGHHVSGNIGLPGVVQGRGVHQRHRVYMGPLDVDRLRGFDVGLESIVEMGWKVIRPVSNLILASMIWMHKFIPNYGWVILIISVLTKVLFYRLTHKSFKSMKDMQDLQPRLQALKEKYKDDKQKQSQEMMKLYREAGVNPLGGCLPMLLQMPVFIALFNVLKFTIELRGANWFGWITDLSQQDVLFRLPMALPLLGDAFSLMPVLMGVSMFLQTRLGGGMGGMGGSGGAQQLPPGFNAMMPVVFTVLFYKMPSGLVLYWLVNTVLSIAQQWYINRDKDSPKPAAA